MVQSLVKSLTEEQVLYREVGGVHTSILSDGERVVISAEDIGRHNSLDKIAGRCLIENIEPMRKILVTTGRISSEMIQKAARIGAAIVISRTSASSLSVALAEKWGITLVGYARHNQFIVYTHPERIRQQTMVIA
jgi:FdhD protein